MSTEAKRRASVVVPAYNAASTLPACLAAMRRQTLPPAGFETIVADDGSSDGTAAAALAAGADQVLSLPHRGPAAARNAGIAAARGEIVLFTDADCQPAPDWLAQMLQPLDDPGVIGVKGSYKSRQREVVARLAQCEFEERYNRQARLPSIDFVDTYAAAFRAEPLREAGGFNPGFPQADNEDVDLSYRLAEHGYRLVFNRKAVVYHRHVATWRGYARLKTRRAYWRTAVYRLHPGKALRDSYTPQLLKLQVLLVFVVSAFALLAPLWPPLLAGTAVGLAALVLSAWPFTRLVLALDRPVTPWAPCFIVLRACAFAVGVIAGVAALLIGWPALPRNAAVPGEG